MAADDAAEQSQNGLEVVPHSEVEEMEVVVDVDDSFVPYSRREEVEAISSFLQVPKEVHHLAPSSCPEVEGTSSAHGLVEEVLSFDDHWEDDSENSDPDRHLYRRGSCSWADLVPPSFDLQEDESLFHHHLDPHHHSSSWGLHHL